MEHELSSIEWKLQRNSEDIKDNYELRKQHSYGSKGYTFFNTQIQTLRDMNRQLLRDKRSVKKEQRAIERAKRLQEQHDRQAEREEKRLFYVRPSRKKITLMGRAVQSLGEDKQEIAKALTDIEQNIATL